MSENMKRMDGFQIIFGYKLEFKKYEKYLKNNLNDADDEIGDVYYENITKDDVCENKNLILRSYPTSCNAEYLVIGIKLANITLRDHDKPYIREDKCSTKQLNVELKKIKIRELIDFTQKPYNHVVDLGCDCCT